MLDLVDGLDLMRAWWENRTACSNIPRARWNKKRFVIFLNHVWQVGFHREFRLLFSWVRLINLAIVPTWEGIRWTWVRDSPISDGWMVVVGRYFIMLRKDPRALFGHEVRCVKISKVFVLIVATCNPKLAKPGTLLIPRKWSSSGPWMPKFLFCSVGELILTFYKLRLCTRGLTANKVKFSGVPLLISIVIVNKSIKK